MPHTANQIQLSASSRGITDHFFCFTCDEHVWDCEHLVDARLAHAERVDALAPSQLQSFAYDGQSRTLEIAFRVTAPFIHNEMPLPPPPRVIHYFNVPRYVFTKLIRCKSARAQERCWEDHIRRKFICQTVRTVCRLPRIYRMREARNVKQWEFEQYVAKLSDEERLAVVTAVAAMKLLLK